MTFKIMPFTEIGKSPNVFSVFHYLPRPGFVWLFIIILAIYDFGYPAKFSFAGWLFYYDLSLFEFFYTNLKTVKSEIISNCGEFAIIKTGIINLFPNSKIF